MAAPLPEETTSNGPALAPSTTEERRLRCDAAARRFEQALGALEKTVEARAGALSMAELFEERAQMAAQLDQLTAAREEDEALRHQALLRVDASIAALRSALGDEEAQRVLDDATDATAPWVDRAGNDEASAESGSGGTEAEGKS
ncbi:MAG: hypothetical protein AAFV62_00035 [Pseudomonadota bacterium]